MAIKIDPEEKQDLVGFGMSLLIHVGLLLLLSLLLVKDDIKQVAVTILSSPVEEDLIEDVSIQDISEFSETETRLSPNEASQSAPVVLETNAPEQTVSFDSVAPSQPSIDFLAESEALVDVGTVHPRWAGEGAKSEGVTTVGGAVDRLTAEIVASAAQKDTLVVWLFDASLSLNAQRARIAERLEKILKEIDSDADLNPIKHVVCSFGETMSVIIKEPSQDREKIVRVIRDMALDESGIENIFTAVEKLANDYKSTTNIRTMIVAFTDEVGDDQAKVDRTVGVATRNGVVVHVVGTPAPFGLARTELKFVDPDEKFDQSERWVEVEQGPESLFKMTLNVSSTPIDVEPMDSGFGPYALSRLCAATGGIYFSLHPNRNVGAKVGLGQISPMTTNIQHFFDGEVMKKYPPDYRPAAAQTAEATNHPTKQALLASCSQKPIDVQRELKTFFDAPNQGQFVTELGEAQKTAASLLTKIDPLHTTLQKGQKTADSLKDARWRASYFLAIGRILAIKTRLDAYNAILGDAKGGLKAKGKDTNRWILEPTNDSALLNTTLKKQSELARKYLKTVVKEFPETPWALFAQNELNLPMSFKWVESRFEPVAMGPGGNANPPSAPQDDKKKVLDKPKPQRKVDKI